MLKKLKSNKSGFTLTEVLISVMVLTVALVAASNLLVTLMRSNDNNSKSLQAYYIAVEGIEAVRNIRDTNWLHNRDWLGSDPANGDFWGEDFDIWAGGSDTSQEYVVELLPAAFDVGVKQRDASNVFANLGNVSDAKPWEIEKYSTVNGNVRWADWQFGDLPSVFTRVITISPYVCDRICDSNDPEEMKNFIQVESKVTWDVGSGGEVVLTEVLSNWKGGVL